MKVKKVNGLWQIKFKSRSWRNDGNVALIESIDCSAWGRTLSDAIKIYSDYTGIKL